MGELRRLTGKNRTSFLTPIYHRRPLREHIPFGLAGNGPVGDHSDYLHPHFCDFEYSQPAGRQMLRRSIDRLETLRCLSPDDPVSVLDLGACYSLPGVDTFDPDRAEELLRQAYELGKLGKPISNNTLFSFGFGMPIGPESCTGAALVSLAHIGYDHAKNQFIESERPRATERIVFALDHLPPDAQWERLNLLQDLIQVGRQQGGIDWQNDFLDRVDRWAVEAVEPPGSKDFKPGPGEEPPRLAARRKCMVLILHIAKLNQDRPDICACAIDILLRWATGDEKDLALLGRTGLSLSDLRTPAFLKAADFFRHEAETPANLGTPEGRQKRVSLIGSAARSYVRGGEAGQGLRLLLAVEDELGVDPIVGRMWGFEVGQCYEAARSPARSAGLLPAGDRDRPGHQLFQSTCRSDHRAGRRAFALRSENRRRIFSRPTGACHLGYAVGYRRPAFVRRRPQGPVRF